MAESNLRRSIRFDIAQSASPQVRLRLLHRPVEDGKPINATIGNDKSIGATKARIKIADFDQTKPVERDAVDVKFRAKLKADSTRLQTWFIDDKAQSRGAYYCYVSRL
ncbi:MAG TPA: hypothetical protein VJJ98_12220 [Sedimentisphaerales bacterium]|nr:hypothetical protein [Sedimentisphaerales bacterium]